MYVRNPDREIPFLSFVRLYCQIDYYCKSFTFLLSFYFKYYCILGLYRLHCCLAICMWFWSSETWFLNLCVFPLPTALSPVIFLQQRVCVCVQLYPTLCNPMDCSPPGSSCPWDFLGKKTGTGCHFLLQGISLTQGSNPHILCPLHCTQILPLLSHQGSP